MRLLLIYILSWVLSTDIELKEIRNLYDKAAFDEKANSKLISILESQSKNSAILMGYKGSAIALMAKHSYNPYKKIKYFNEGKSLLEKAIATDPDNVELIFLRFAIQTNVPSILNYNQNIRSDKVFLYSMLEKKAIEDYDLKVRIKNYLIKCNELTLDKKEKIKIF